MVTLIQCNTARHRLKVLFTFIIRDTVQDCTVQYSTVQYITVQYSKTYQIFNISSTVETDQLQKTRTHVLPVLKVLYTCTPNTVHMYGKLEINQEYLIENTPTRLETVSLVARINTTVSSEK